MSELMKGSNLDMEWVTLMIQAKNLGMSIEEIRAFLMKASAETK